MARHAHVARENVRGDAEAGNVTNVAGAIGIRPGNRRENVRTHGLHPIATWEFRGQVLMPDG